MELFHEIRSASYLCCCYIGEDQAKTLIAEVFYETVRPYLKLRIKATTEY
jgi:hypothetical protein